MTQPSLETPRLALRPFSRSDASVIQQLAGDWSIADTTLNIPYPYVDGVAEQWIESHQSGYEAGKSAAFAMVQHLRSGLVGAIGLRINSEHNKAELGYWVGKPHWNLGYASEATVAVLAFGFETLMLNDNSRRSFVPKPGFGTRNGKGGHAYRGYGAPGHSEVG